MNLWIRNNKPDNRDYPIAGGSIEGDVADINDRWGRIRKLNLSNNIGFKSEPADKYLKRKEVIE
jgi:hypothetical protein